MAERHNFGLAACQWPSWCSSERSRHQEAGEGQRRSARSVRVVLASANLFNFPDVDEGLDRFLLRTRDT